MPGHARSPGRFHRPSSQGGKQSSSGMGIEVGSSWVSSPCHGLHRAPGGQAPTCSDGLHEQGVGHSGPCTSWPASRCYPPSSGYGNTSGGTGRGRPPSGRPRRMGGALGRQDETGDRHWGCC